MATLIRAQDDSNTDVQIPPISGVGLGVLLALPWVFPYVWGPSPAVLQLLATLASAGLALILWPGRRTVALFVFGWLACGSIGVYVLSPTKELDGALLGLLAAIACVAAGAGIGATADQGKTWRIVAFAWLLAGVANALAGYVQFLGWSKAFDGWVSASSAGQVFGNLRQRNQFATLLNLALVAAVVLQAQKTSLWTRLTINACVVLFATANALSSSRVGALGLLVACALCCYYSRNDIRSARRCVLLAVTAYGGTALVGYFGSPHGEAAGILDRLRPSEVDCNSRLVLWDNVLNLISQRFWRGWGWGQLDYAHFSTMYEGSRFCEILDNAHNLPLHLAVELGVPIASGLLILFSTCVLRARPWRDAVASRQLAWMVLVLMMLHGLVEYPMWYGPFQLTAGLCIGLLLPRSMAQGQARPFWAATAHRSLGVLILSVAAYAAWDYWRVGQLYRPPDRRAATYRSDTLERVSDSWIFREQVRFARLVTTTLTPENAKQIHDLAAKLLHFSPEPAVIEKFIASARMIGRDEEAVWASIRYSAAFPADYARWQALATSQ